MISKEEKEKIKRKLAEELENTIKANQCGLSTNDFSENIETLETALEYIQQLETKQQKVIDKLEHDNKIDNTAVKKLEEKRRTATSDYYKNSYQTQIHKLNAKIEVRKEILKSIKGEEK